MINIINYITDVLHATAYVQLINNEIMTRCIE